jgi:2-polyprenyl-6-methoxyphenol hydroxylase-like FAD-dependent oxidoreductase
VPYAELGWESYGILRSALLDVLVTAVPDECIRLNARCEAVEGARVVLADGSTIEADLIVGADGLYSRVRRSLHGDEPLRYGGHRAWRTSVAFDHPRICDRFTEVWGVGGGFGFGPAGAGNVYWYCFHVEPENAPEPTDLRATLLRRYGHWFEPIPALVEATPAAALHSTLTYDRRPLRTWGRGRVTLLGDAAHPMKPNIGQGAAQALEDAVVLGNALRDAADLETALRQYERQRVKRANAIVRASRQAGVVAEVRSRVGARVRDTIFRALPNAVTTAQQRRVLEFEP